MKPNANSASANAVLPSATSAVRSDKRSQRATAPAPAAAAPALRTGRACRCRPARPPRRGRRSATAVPRRSKIASHPVSASSGRSARAARQRRAAAESRPASRCQSAAQAIARATASALAALEQAAGAGPQQRRQQREREQARQQRRVVALAIERSGAQRGRIRWDSRGARQALHGVDAVVTAGRRMGARARSAGFGMRTRTPDCLRCASRAGAPGRLERRSRQPARRPRATQSPR